MKKGDFVLITAGSSSLGLAAIEIVKAEGAISIVTTRNAIKRGELPAGQPVLRRLLLNNPEDSAQSHSSRHNARSAVRFTDLRRESAHNIYRGSL